MKLWVSDTSPLLFLAKLDRLDLLRQAAGEILAPHAVFREIRQRSDEARRILEEAQRSWLKARAVTDTAQIPSLRAEVEKLLECGFRAHEDLVTEVLRAAGEA